MSHAKIKKPSKAEQLDLMGPAAMLQTEHDFKDALLMISISANLFLLSLWVALQVTTSYDAALTSFFFSR